MNTLALVLGGHVNGYSIVKELYEEGVNDIALFDYGRSLARYSNKVNYCTKINKTSEGLLSELLKLNQKYDYIVLFPTDDLQLENLSSIYDQIQEFCYIPFNQENILKCLDKSYQYEICEKNDIPYPKTVNIRNAYDLDHIEELTFPLLIKPSIRKDLYIDVFRNIYIENINIYEKEKQSLIDYIHKGVEFLVSEFIPGDDTNIYAYTCFRSNEGDILNGWAGKKLTQYPDNYGVFCSASNESPDVVEAQGKALVDALNIYGIAEPEFKYDARDGKYKLMEVNLRSMMWHRIGNISGVCLQKTQFNYAINKPIEHYIQDKSQSIHLVLMLHEIPNLISRKGYWQFFKNNVFGGDKRVWAIFEASDIKPFIYSLYLLSRLSVSLCLKRLGLR